jgi:hypothetical protein
VQDVIALRRGERRERELLKALVADLGEELLTAISALTVRPERTVLGPCKKTVAKIMGNCK